MQEKLEFVIGLLVAILVVGGTIALLVDIVFPILGLLF